MQFGRIADLSSVDFSLPALTPRSRALLARVAPAPAASEWLKIGAPAFRHRDWLGTLYPASAPADDWLRIYSDKVSALELNSTFYGLPSEATVDRWIAETPERFRFCPKVPRTISHELGSSELQARIGAFAARMLRLGSRLGPGLIQLPEKVAPDSLPQLRAALEMFPEDFALAVEVRHPAWFSSAGEVREDLVALLEPRANALVITDVAGRRDACHATITSPFAFVRFVGEGLHPTDEPRVGRWIERLRDWRETGLNVAFFFVHQPDDILAPQLLAIASEHARERGIELPLVTLEAPPAKQLDLF